MAWMGCWLRCWLDTQQALANLQRTWPKRHLCNFESQFFGALFQKTVKYTKNIFEIFISPKPKNFEDWLTKFSKNGALLAKIVVFFKNKIYVRFFVCFLAK